MRRGARCPLHHIKPCKCWRLCSYRPSHVNMQNMGMHVQRSRRAASNMQVGSQAKVGPYKADALVSLGTKQLILESHGSIYHGDARASQFRGSRFYHNRVFGAHAWSSSYDDASATAPECPPCDESALVHLGGHRSTMCMLQVGIQGSTASSASFETATRHVVRCWNRCTSCRTCIANQQGIFDAGRTGCEAFVRTMKKRHDLLALGYHLVETWPQEGIKVSSSSIAIVTRLAPSTFWLTQQRRSWSTDVDVRAQPGFGCRDSFFDMLRLMNFVTCQGTLMSSTEVLIHTGPVAVEAPEWEGSAEHAPRPAL